MTESVVIFHIELRICFIVTVQTGFRMPGDGCIPEGVLQVICLTTVGSPAVDTVLTVSVTYGTAGPEGKWTMYHIFEGEIWQFTTNISHSLCRKTSVLPLQAHNAQKLMFSL